MGGKGAKNRRGMIVCGGKRETPKKARIPFCAFIAGSHRAADLREERNGVMIAGRFSARRLQEDRGGAAEFFHSRVQRRIDTGERWRSLLLAVKAHGQTGCRYEIPASNRTERKRGTVALTKAGNAVGIRGTKSVGRLGGASCRRRDGADKTASLCGRRSHCRSVCGARRLSRLPAAFSSLFFNDLRRRFFSFAPKGAKKLILSVL